LWLKELLKLCQLEEIVVKIMIINFELINYVYTLIELIHNIY